MNTVGADSRPEYYRQSAAAVVEALGSHKMGLTNATAERRHQKDGANLLPASVQPSLAGRWFRAFIHPSALGLLVAMLLSHTLGYDSLLLILLGLFLFDAAVRFTMTYRPVAMVLPELPSHTTVVRNGQIRQIETATLVVGDIVMLERDDAVPADMRLLSVEDFKVAQSALFGTNVPDEKVTHSIRSEVALPLRANMAWAGTRVVGGTGAGIVVAIGAQTELGRTIVLANAVSASQKTTSPRHSYIGWLLICLVLGSAAVIALAASINSVTLVKGLLVLDVASLPLGLWAAYLITLLRMKPRVDTKLAALAQLGAVDTLLTSEASVARFKMFGLRILHISHGSKVLDVRKLDDTQLAQQVQTGSASFGDLGAEEKLRLVIVAQAAKHRVAAVGASASDLPALLQADCSFAESSNLAALFAAARAARAVVWHVLPFVLSWTTALAALALCSVIAFWSVHIPMVLNVPLLMVFSVIIIPLLSAGRPAAARAPLKAELAARAGIAAALAYGAFLITFTLQGIDPAYIDPLNPLVLQASSVTFAVLVVCAIIDQAFSVNQKKICYHAVAAALLLLVIYSPGLQTALGTVALGARDWVIVLAAGSIYAATLLLQHHTRHHSRRAVVALHHKAYGKTSGVRM